ncbi:zinc finger protein-domain-containing protein [Massariosphaeria phaeospora]|uniref:Zinc finger protein-domain-containing protein n=1 Tax=Massariosphaeria phaeospora TaxID=100035 RepID=A0A7C8I0W8_9PLEO|nr:zinc finger protein-domain-containing protein [Massariosphaeria phaeospora]
MWLLDFDCCRYMSMDEAGIEQACAAFFRNDPYYPRPCGADAADRILWVEFKERFLTASRAILLEKRNVYEVDASLPERLMSKIEEKGLVLQKKKDDLAAGSFGDGPEI